VGPRPVWTCGRREKHFNLREIPPRTFQLVALSLYRLRYYTPKINVHTKILKLIVAFKYENKFSLSGSGRGNMKILEVEGEQETRKALGIATSRQHTLTATKRGHAGKMKRITVNNYTE
jgi:hypothetical protein